MKKIILLFTFATILISCEKDYLIPNREVPDWLKSKIKHDEQIIDKSSSSWINYGGWIRYTLRDENYFEYHNELSSSMPVVVSFQGDTLHFYATDQTTDYYKEKCCKCYVWKAPNFHDYGIK